MFEEEDGFTRLGDLDIWCNLCGQPLKIGCSAKIVGGQAGHQDLTFRPDFTELFAHAWRHEQQPGYDATSPGQPLENP